MYVLMLYSHYDMEIFDVLGVYDSLEKLQDIKETMSALLDDEFYLTYSTYEVNTCKGDIANYFKGYMQQ